MNFYVAEGGSGDYVFVHMAISLSDVFKAFGYTLSLPERLVRSTAAAVGGVSKLLTDTIIPEPLRKTTAYTAMVGEIRLVDGGHVTMHFRHPEAVAEAIQDLLVRATAAGG